MEQQATLYQYLAYNEAGEIVKGKVPAPNEEAAADLLSYAGYKAISLKPYVPFLNLDKLRASLFHAKPDEVVLLYRQLAMLLESGIDIVASLELLEMQTTNRALKKVLDAVISDLRGGSQLSTALSKHPEVFPPVYCRLLHVGEQSGDLETMLKQVADYLEREVAATKDTKNALVYPVIISVVTFLVIGLLVTFVLPSFGSLYASLGIELPPVVKVMIATASTVQSHWQYLFLGVLVAIGLALVYIRTPKGRQRWDKLLLRLPLIGRVNHLHELIRCCRSMALMFRAGLPLTEVMPLAIQGTKNKAIARALEDVQRGMVKGEGLSQPMSKNKLFLPMMVQMVRVGEETGNLDTTLLAVARAYEAEAENKTRSLISLIQPAMTIIIGLIVGLIALSITSAIYSLYGQGF
ncbi:MAG TPA: type II secretion system F family protein [Dehalococcoidia bacterium]|jgi:type IV pilus assembly protein PilC|nr:type II secretion system F family protein [Dehalococcoidia bacterium]